MNEHAQMLQATMDKAMSIYPNASWEPGFFESGAIGFLLVEDGHRIAKFDFFQGLQSLSEDEYDRIPLTENEFMALFDSDMN